MIRKSITLALALIALIFLHNSTGRAGLVLQSSSASQTSQSGSTSPYSIDTTLDNWLADPNHSKVGNAMLWEIPITSSPIPHNYPTASTTDSSTPTRANAQLSYPEIQNDVVTSMCLYFSSQAFSWYQWSAAQKTEVRNNFNTYSAWLKTNWPLYAAYRASNFAQKPAGFDQAFNPQVDADPSPMGNTPANLQIDANDVDFDPQHPTTIISNASAFRLYAKKVAFQLALEIGGYLPSVLNYSDNYLRELFDGRKQFRYVTPNTPPNWGVKIRYPGYWVETDVPGSPLMTFSYLAQNKLIGAGSTDALLRKDTLLRIFEWERTHLYHTMAGTIQCGKSYGEALWGYNGSPPLITVLNGYQMQCPLYYTATSYILYPDPVHWTGGCGGTAGFNNVVFGYLNIPSQLLSFSHFENGFALGDQTLYTDHADDPYGSCDEIPMERIMLDAPTFYKWFINTKDPLKNVSRRVADLNNEYLPMCMIKDICRYDNDPDPYHTNTPLASSYYYTGYMEQNYSDQDPVIIDTYSKVQAKIKSLGGCNTILWGPTGGN